MRCRFATAWLATFLTLGLAPWRGGLEAQLIRPARPQPQQPLKLPDAETVRREIAEARGVEGIDLPSGKALKQAAGEVDGEIITLDELLDEVMIKFGAPLVPLMANQAMMKLEVMKRGVEVTDQEFLETVRYRKAQSPSNLTLKEMLLKSRMGWDRFAESIRTTAAICKIVKADQNIKTPGPPNQFLMQIWANTLRKDYQIETKQENLPDGCFARVTTTWGLADVLRVVLEARAKGRPYRLGREKTASGAGALVFTPPGGGWPRFTVPDVKTTVTRFAGGKAESSEMGAEELLKIVVEGGGQMAQRVVVFRADDPAPELMLPWLKVARAKKSGLPPERVPLTEAVTAILEKGFVVDTENGRVRPREGEGPVYTVPATVCETYQPPFRRRLVHLLKDLEGTKRRAAPYLVLARKRDADFVLLPPVPVEMKTLVDRPAILALAFGSMKLAHFDEALESLARFRAVKKAFAGYLPGTPATGKPNAPWGVITVNEKQVAERIAKERAKYDGTIFPWEMICQILGKTVPGEMRRFWIGNGVDQIIGTDVDDKTLKQYYEDHIVHFGVATAEANHILIQKKDPKTGRINWAAAKKEAEKVLAMIRTGADFGAMARKYSEDPATKDKDGDLGLFTLVSRYDFDLCKAVFAMEAGEISKEPVRTRLGYHIIRVRKKDPPNRAKYGWESDGMKERVREYRQARLEEAWLKENVYGKYHLKSYLESIFP